MKPLAIALSGVERGLQGEDGGNDLTNVQCEAIRIVTMRPTVQQIYSKKVREKDTRKPKMPLIS
jgi:hypothetical protein